LKQLKDYQLKAIERMHNGCVLVGGVGSGKTLTSLAFVFTKWLKGVTPLIEFNTFKKQEIEKDIYVITTARKRDSLDWIREASNIPVNLKVVDSWNNIKKYETIKDAIFIFDETRVLGYGSWTHSFLKITSKNQWILLSATPADTWMDFMPVFIANGYYKNKTEFIREHVIYSRFSKYPKVERYINPAKLIRIKNNIVVQMNFVRQTKQHHIDIFCDYDKNKFNTLLFDRWNIYDNCPIKDAGQLCYSLRRVVNSDTSRIEALNDILKQHHKIIIFYNFDYELFILREWCESINILFTEWNGHNHNDIPDGESWVYLCQYIAAAEAWNATTTNCIVFFSPTYSYKGMIQASGRIDRMDTNYVDLYYYHLLTKSIIDLAIQKSLNSKQNFNESKFLQNL